MTTARGGRRLTQNNRPDWRFDPSEAMDLRRTHPTALVDRLLGRLEWLPKPERALIEQVYRDGRSATEVGLLSGETPRVVRRRIRRIVRRLMSDKTAFVVKGEHRWAPTRRRVALVCYIEGLSMREASRRLGLSLHTVRRHAAAIDAMFEASMERDEDNAPTSPFGWRNAAGSA